MCSSIFTNVRQQLGGSKATSGGLWQAVCIGLLLSVFSGCAARCQIEASQLSEVSKIRKLPFLREVECKQLRQSQVNGYVRRSVRERNDPARLYVEGRIFKLLGLLPADYPYPEGVIQQYANDLLALYSTEERRIIFVSRQKERAVAEDSRRLVLQHELIHALQDQHYDLQAMIDPTLSNDKLIARMSLLEGDASWVSRSPECKGDPAVQCNLDSTAETLHSLFNLADARDSTPRLLRVMMEFPYVFGDRLACLINCSGVNGLVDAAYRTPPQTTAELLFPRRYLKRIKRQKVTRISPEVEGLPSQWEARSCVGDYPYTDTLGPLFVVAFLTERGELKATFHHLLTLVESWRADQIVYDPVNDSYCWEVEFSNVVGALEFVDRIAKRPGSSGAVESTLAGLRVVVRGKASQEAR